MSDFTPTKILDTPVTNIGPVQGKVSVTVKAKKGTFTLSVEGDTTGDIKFNATAEEVKAALEALGAVDTNDFVVTGGPGDELGTNPYFIAASAGSQYDGANFPTFTADAAKLEEGAHTATVATVTTGLDEPADVVQRGVDPADATERTRPLNTGESPAARREAHGSEFGDA